MLSKCQRKSTRCAEISFESNFTFVKLRNKAKLEVADVLEISQYLNREGVARDSLIFHLGENFDASASVCDFYCSSSFGRSSDYHALVIPSHTKRFLINASIMMRNPGCKFKTFIDFDSAVKWLSQNQNKQIVFSAESLRISSNLAMR